MNHKMMNTTKQWLLTIPIQELKNDKMILILLQMHFRPSAPRPNAKMDVNTSNKLALLHFRIV